MKTSLALVLVSLSGVAFAQTPATNPMPDGSHDMYVGLGAVSAPKYEGANKTRVRALPVLQMEWSNGIFVSGLTAGMHLSSDPVFEYGPLLGITPGRDSEGSGAGAGGTSGTGTSFLPGGAGIKLASVNRLAGMDEIGARLQAGGFFNYYLTPGLRLTNSILAGAGADHNGLAWRPGLQQIAGEIAPHHWLSVSVGATLVNGAWNRSYFGVTEAEAARSGNRAYTPSGGLKDVNAGVRWNWAFSPSWMLTSNANVARLTGDAKNSPLVQRPTNVTVSTALAYRF
jgi:outer membrane protein